MSAYSQMLVEKSSRKQELWFRFDSDVFWLQDLFQQHSQKEPLGLVQGRIFSGVLPRIGAYVMSSLAARRRKIL